MFRRVRAFAVLALTVLLPSAVAVFGAEAEAEVRFVVPRHLSTVMGPATLELDLSVPRGSKVERVEVYVDRKLLTTLTRPPWRAQWDAGDAVRGHQLEALLFLTDGSEIRGAVRTSPLRINQIEGVGLVNLYALVRDKRGNYVSDLRQRDFRILESGRPQMIRQFTTERKPLRVGIVLDTSLTMEGRKLSKAKNAALDFLDVLQPQDEGMVITFNDTVDVAQETTSDKGLLSGAIQAAHASGGTALFDGVWRAARSLQGFDGRRVLVLLSDGRRR